MGGSQLLPRLPFSGVHSTASRREGRAAHHCILSGRYLTEHAAAFVLLKSMTSATPATTETAPCCMPTKNYAGRHGYGPCCLPANIMPKDRAKSQRSARLHRSSFQVLHRATHLRQRRRLLGACSKSAPRRLTRGASGARAAAARRAPRVAGQGRWLPRAHAVHQ